jgi:uncharacterized protein
VRTDGAGETGAPQFHPTGLQPPPSVPQMVAMIATCLRCFLAALLVSLLVPLAPANAQEDCAAQGGASRVALVIGNGDYSAGDWDPLKNAISDAKSVCESLARAGFGVELVTDASAANLRVALSRFAERAKAADTAIVYFAGHGFEYLGTGYLVPVDGPAPPAVAPAEMVSRFVPLDEFAIAAARAKRFQFVFLDACRVSTAIATVPGSGAAGQAFRTISKDLPPDFDWSGILVYSTSRNRYAYDAAPEGSENSPFAKAISARMLEPGKGFASFLKDVAVDVRDTTQDMPQGAQLPTAWGIAGDEFKFLDADAKVTLALKPRTPAVSVAIAAVVLAPSQVAPFAGLTPAQLGIVDEPVLIARLMRSHSSAEIVAAANAGDPVAQYLLGYMLHFGDNMPKDMGLARIWLEKAAASGHPAGQTELAYFLARNAPLGPTGDADRARARALFEAAVTQGFAKAQSHYAHALLYGTLSPVDKPRALSLFRAAADAGHIYANFALGTLGDGDAAEKRLRAIVAAGNGEGNLWLCELYNAQNRAGAALNECRTAAEFGYAGARAITARIYAEGMGIGRSIEDAEYWARLALKTPDLEHGPRAQMLSLLAGLGKKP